MDATDLLSIGRLACDLRVSVPRLRQLLNDLGIRPEMTLNGVPYVPADTADRVFPLLHSKGSPPHDTIPNES